MPLWLDPACFGALTVSRQEATVSATGRELTAFTDASGQVWYSVPGYGPVTWPVDQITEHARYLRDIHRPDKTALMLRLALAVVPLAVRRSRRCKLCLSRWPCRDARWAKRWLTRDRTARP